MDVEQHKSENPDAKSTINKTNNVYPHHDIPPLSSTIATRPNASIVNHGTQNLVCKQFHRFLLTR